MKNTLNRIDLRLSELQKKKSQMLADLNIPSSTYSTWKKKQAVPDMKYLLPIAEYLGVSLEYLLKGKQDTVTATSDTHTIKVLGRVAAGIPIEAVEDIIGEIAITKEMAENGVYFGLRIAGDSMEPRMYSGDVVLVKQQEDVESGQVAVVMVNGEDATCKKIEKHSNGIMLVPFNNKYEEKFFTNEEIEKLPVRILGRVVEVRGRL